MLSPPQTFSPATFLGPLEEEPTRAPIAGATWYRATDVKQGLAYPLPVGALAGTRYLTADFLLDGDTLAVFLIELRETKTGRSFRLRYNALNQCQARIRLPLALTDQNRWGIDREGAWLKPRCEGDVIDLARVDSLTLTVHLKGPDPVRWCITPFQATREEPQRLDDPILPRGPLIDELGQNALRDWPTKTRSVADLVTRLEHQVRDAPRQHWPVDWSAWGGCTALRFEPTGWFHTHHDGRRWWLVDPDGCAFWSAGLDCVRVNTDGMYRDLETALAWMPERDGPYAAIYGQRANGLVFINYLAANFIRAFGPDAWHAQWTGTALAELRRIGFNTVGNWSEWEIARAASFPYVRPLTPHFPKTPKVFRDFPDVFAPVFTEDAAAYASQLQETRADPALIGYFLMNEPEWGFAHQLPAEGMLMTTPACATRTAFAGYLRQRYATDAALSTAWGEPTTMADVDKGPWASPPPPEARQDLEAFSTLMVERLFGTLNQACRRVDPHHLNLGARYYTVPPRWAFEGMRGFDVFSVNGYGQTVRSELGPYSAEVSQPILIGEWHFGALDAGLPASGIGHVRDQAARGQAYRVYLEDAAAQPWCVGVHWFTLYDESALGRFDGENWNIGFLDICNQPYAPLATAARASHERLYAVVRGLQAPYAEAPEYLPLLF